MDLAEKVTELMGVVLAVLLGFNLIISGVMSILEGFKVKLPEGHFLYKVIDFVQKAIDLISANKKH